MCSPLWVVAATERTLIIKKVLSPCCSAALLPYRAYKTIDDEDLKFPLIYGEGKKVRVPALDVCFRTLTLSV